MRMMGTHTLSRATRLLAAHLLLLVLLVRAVVPAGYMPDFAAAGEGIFKVVICSANGAKSIASSVGDTMPGGQTSGDAACPFTALLAAAAAVEPEFNLALTQTLIGTVEPMRSMTVALFRPGPALGSRAPPAQVLQG